MRKGRKPSETMATTWGGLMSRHQPGIHRAVGRGMKKAQSGTLNHVLQMNVTEKHGLMYCHN